MSRENKLQKLGDLFENYKKRLIAPEATVVDAFIEVVSDKIGYRLDKKRVRYTPSTKTLSLTAGGPLKSEIRLQEKEILTELIQRIGKRNAPTKII